MNKKQIKTLSLIIFGMTVFSCNLNRSPISQPYIEKDVIPAVSINEKVWPFTMNYSYSHINQPVVHLILGQSDYFFVFDTGASYSTLDTEPDSSMEVFDANGKKSIGYDAVINDLRKHISFYHINDYKEGWKKRFASLGIKYQSENQIDGIIGKDFMRNYDNVTIDYINRKIIFDDKKITEEELFMYNSGINSLDDFIYFTVDGLSEFGIIDTGCSTFFCRENFGNGIENNPILTGRELNNYIEKGEKIPLDNNIIQCVSNVQISTVLYKEILAYPYNFTYSIDYDEALTRRKRYHTLLGNSLWENHIIQLDFYHNVFRIK